MATNGVLTLQAMADVQAAIMRACSPDPLDPSAFPVSWMDPRVPIAGAQAATPAPNGYGVLEADDVEVSMSGETATMRKSNHTNVVKILIRKPWPVDPAALILTEQVTVANAVIAELQQASRFGTGEYGLIPLVTSVSYREQGNHVERMYDVSLIFQFYSQVDHH